MTQEEISALKASILRRYVEGKISKKKMIQELARVERIERGGMKDERLEIQGMA